MNEVFVCRMPSICGYGIESYGSTQQESEDGARRKFEEMRQEWHLSDSYDWAGTFEAAMGYFGGTTRKVTIPSVGHEDEAGEVVRSFDD